MLSLCCRSDFHSSIVAEREKGVNRELDIVIILLVSFSSHRERQREANVGNDVSLSFSSRRRQESGPEFSSQYGD